MACECVEGGVLKNSQSSMGAYGDVSEWWQCEHYPDICVCDLQHWTASAVVFLVMKGEGFHAGSEGQANRGLHKPTVLCRTIETLNIHD